MSQRVLISAPYFVPVVEHFRAEFAARGIDLVVARVRERLEEHELLPLIGDVDGVICGDDRFTPAVFAAAPRLRVISKWGTGVDSIDAAAAARHGVRICRTPGAFTLPVTDSVFGYMLAFARRIPWQTDQMRSGHWEKLPSVTLAECTLGVIGVGDIGAAVARRAAVFGMRIRGCDIRPIDAQLVAETGLASMPLEHLVGGADFVTVHCDLNPTSVHLLSTPQFAAMRPGTVVINTARGPIIDEPALVAALESGHLGGAALDVFEDEPLPATSALRRLPNVLLAAHNANSSPGAWERVHRSTVDNLMAALNATS